MEEDFSLSITKVANGYLVIYNEDGIGIKKVFEEQDTEDGELECTKNLLYYIKEHFGVYYSKHNKNNLVLNIEKTNE